MEKLLNYSMRVTARHSSQPWRMEHLRACMAPNPRLGQEVTIVALCQAIHHAVTSLTLPDYVLGPEVEAIIDACDGLLNADCGRLDCGTVSGWLETIRSTVEKETVS